MICFPFHTKPSVNCTEQEREKKTPLSSAWIYFTPLPFPHFSICFQKPLALSAITVLIWAGWSVNGSFASDRPVPGCVRVTRRAVQSLAVTVESLAPRLGRNHLECNTGNYAGLIGHAESSNTNLIKQWITRVVSALSEVINIVSAARAILTF